jgi:murein DD-endopeptidase MepM/ murein hydrolase activator NlpD
MNVKTRTNRNRAAVLFVLAIMLALAQPATALAFNLFELWGSVQPVAEAAAPSPLIHSFLTPALTAAVHVDPNPAKGGGDITVVDDVALLAETGPEGTLADIEESESSNNQISLYVVRRGDTLSGIAKMFGVSTNTVLWANDLKSARDIHPGDQLVILPISGVRHTVVKGETLASIIKKYKGDADEVLAYNGWESGHAVKVGDTVIIPHGVESAPIVTGPTSRLRSAGGPEISGYFMRPLIGGRKSQGLHGYNGIDIAAPIGTPILASASGTVTVARGSGYNGGYGQYVVVSHPNGTQTVYGHLSSVIVGQGQYVVQGQVIGYSGNTGKSTGAHLHFEIRGARNPF